MFALIRRIFSRHKEEEEAPELYSGLDAEGVEEEEEDSYVILAPKARRALSPYPRIIRPPQAHACARHITGCWCQVYGECKRAKLGQEPPIVFKKSRTWRVYEGRGGGWIQPIG